MNAATTFTKPTMENRADLLQNYQHSVDCLIQCEYLVVSLQEQLAAKDRYISSLEWEGNNNPSEESLVATLQEQLRAKDKEIATLKQGGNKDTRSPINQFESIVAVLQQQLSQKSKKIASLEEAAKTQTSSESLVESLQELIAVKEKNISR